MMIETRQLLAAINHAPTAIAVTAERAFLKVLDGSCRTPIAGHAVVTGDRIDFRGMVFQPNGEARTRRCGLERLPTRRRSAPMRARS